MSETNHLNVGRSWRDRVRQRRKTEEEVQEVFVGGEKEKEDVKKMRMCGRNTHYRGFI